MADSMIEYYVESMFSELKRIAHALEKINEAQLAGLKMVGNCPVFDGEEDSA